MTHQTSTGDDIVYLPPENTGDGFLLAKYPPYNKGVVYKFQSNESFDSFIRNRRLAQRCAVIEGYNVLVAWVGNQNSKFENPPAGEHVPADAITDLKKMAQYYFDEKLKSRSPSFLNKYRRQ